jgi:hypothetical protein
MELMGSLDYLYYPNTGTYSTLSDGSRRPTCLSSARLILILYFYLPHAYMGW